MGEINYYTKIIRLLFLLVWQFHFLWSHAQKTSFITKVVNRVAVGAKFNYAFLATDSLKRKINYSCTNLPSWIYLDKNKNTLSGIAKNTGQYFIQINAATNDTVIKQQFMLTVYDRETMNILPLGNSITNGTSIYNSYRRSLWQLLEKANYNFDFIGSWDKHHMGGVVPNADFDMDHDGHSGWKASDILHPPDWDKQRGNIDDWLKIYKPDIVLMELGTNEVFQCTTPPSAIKDISAIIDKLRKKNPSIKILLAQIPPLGNQWAPKKLCKTDTSYAQAIQIFNEAVLRFVKTKTTARSPVIIVDQYTGVIPATDMYDDIHPNTKGEVMMAERWYKAVTPFLKKLK